MDKKSHRSLSRVVGLARTLSKLGYCSRAKAAALAREGRVSVNDIVRRDPEYPVARHDRVAVEDEPITRAEFVYLALNKPRGLVTTASDEEGRATVYALLDNSLPWVAPVGRLDKASEGLLLLTNDSEWAASITAPSSGIPKTYHVQIGVVGNEALIARLKAGVADKKEHLAVQDAEILRLGTRNSWLKISLTEGRNRHIRRMFASMGIEVLRLVRVAIGPLALGELAKGAVRNLTAAEKKGLDKLVLKKDAREVVIVRAKATP